MAKALTRRTPRTDCGVAEGLRTATATDQGEKAFGESGHAQWVGLSLTHPLSSSLLFLRVPRSPSASSALMLFSALPAKNASKPREANPSGRPSRPLAPFATFALKLFSAIGRDDAARCSDSSRPAPQTRPTDAQPNRTTTWCRAPSSVSGMAPSPSSRPSSVTRAGEPRAADGFSTRIAYVAAPKR